MVRRANNQSDLTAIEARRETLRAELAELDERAKVAELAARDAGRTVLTAALDRVKIASMDKADAKTIAAAIGDHGGKAVAERLASLLSA